jgi:heptosyltransferase-2
MPQPSEQILVRGVNWLGDAVMTTPALRRLREAKPSARITLFTHEKLAGLWTGQPFIDEVMTFSNADNPWQVSRRVRERNFTCAVVFPNSIRSALELWLARIPRRIGFARPGRGLFLTDALPPRRDAVPMRKRSVAEIRRLIATNAPPETIPAAANHIHDYLFLTAALGASATPIAPRIFVTDQQTAALCQKLHLENASAERPWFGLNPGAEYGPAKRWPANRFAAAAVILQKHAHCRWLIFGGPGDVASAEKITAEICHGGGAPGDVLNLAGKTTLNELAAALKMCRLVLSNDTGPMHLAAAVGTPVVVPFGSTSPELTAPVFSAPVKIVRVPVPCAPCFRRECPIDLRCLEEIKITQVVSAATEILGESAG